MKNAQAAWQTWPWLLTVDNKRIRLSTSKQYLDLFKRNPHEFLRQVVSADETWIHYYTPETKQQSKQAIFPNEFAPKRIKTGLSDTKVTATIFWNSKEIILIEFLEKGRTTTSQYYSELLDQFEEKLKETRPHLAKKKVLFHHDNAPTHSSGIVAAKLHELRYKGKIKFKGGVYRWDKSLF